MLSDNVWLVCEQALLAAEPAIKVELTLALFARLEQGNMDWQRPENAQPIIDPGRPTKPELVAPRALSQRKLGSVEGRRVLIHAVAHIEFNAINLALDAAHRFQGMPPEYVRDWLSVAADEARHFQMLQRRLQELDASYGDYPAHNGLWEMAQKTAADVVARMALVPRVLEARGLDVTPAMIQKLQKAGDVETVALLEVILDEEQRHVEIGSRWFRYCCQQQQLEPESTFKSLIEQYMAGQLRGPFNMPARRAGGFSESELEWLAGL